MLTFYFFINLLHIILITLFKNHKRKFQRIDNYPYQKIANHFNTCFSQSNFPHYTKSGESCKNLTKNLTLLTPTYSANDTWHRELSIKEIETGVQNLQEDSSRKINKVDSLRKKKKKKNLPWYSDDGIPWYERGSTYKRGMAMTSWSPRRSICAASRAPVVSAPWYPGNVGRGNRRASRAEPRSPICSDDDRTRSWAADECGNRG